MDEFQCLHKATVVDKQITKAAKSSKLTNKAQRIAAAIGGEHIATRSILKGLVKATVEENELIIEPQRKLQSTEATFEKLLKKKRKKAQQGK